MRFRHVLTIGLMSLIAASLGAEDSKNGSQTKTEAVQLSPSKELDKEAVLKSKLGSKEVGAADENCKDSKQIAGNSRPDATHKQARTLTPKHNGAKIHLNTYCLTPSGELLACVGGQSIEYLPNPDNPEESNEKRTEAPMLVQRYSPDGELLAEIKLDFKPTAINMVPGGKEFVVAGEGWMARMTLQGESIKKSRTPNVGDLEKFKEQAVKAAKDQVKEYVAQFEDQLKAAEAKLAKLEQTPEADRTKSVKAQIEAQKTIADQSKQQIAGIEQSFGVGDPEAAVRARLTVTGIAATDKDLFVCVKKTKGHGYDVWRTEVDFTKGEKVVEDLGGCCGQLDIQAADGKLMIAENGKFRVGIYDRDGEMTSSFGKRDRKSAEGFGSCCNPMNVRCCANGEILTAESSIGDIKRFAPDGKFLGYIGRAKIGGGCKHVAIEYDAARDRYYMQHEDKGHICVLVPKSEITGPSEDEILEKAAREGLGAKLVGSWKVPGTKQAKKKGVVGLLNSALGGGGQRSQNPADQLTFNEDGELKISGGYLSNYQADSQMEWKAIRQDGKQLNVGVVIDGVENFNFKVTFQSDDSLQIDLCYENDVMAKAAYERDAATAKADVQEKAKTTPNDSSN